MTFFIPQVYVSIGNLFLGDHVMEADQFELVDHTTLVAAEVGRFEHDAMRQAHPIVGV